MSHLTTSRQLSDQSAATSVGIVSRLIPMVPSIAAITIGAILILSADGMILKLIGAAAAGIPFLLSDIPTIKRTLFTAIMFLTPLELDVRVGQLPKTEDLRNLMNGYDISVATFCVVAFLLLMIAEYFGGAIRDLRPYKAALPGIAYLGTLILSLTVAQDIAFSMFEIVQAVEWVALLVVVIYYLRDNDELIYATTVLVLGLALQALIMLGQVSFGLSIEFGPLHTARLGRRVSGTFGHPNVVAEYMSLIMFPALGMAISRVKPSLKVLGGITFVMAAFAMVFTLSRGAWLGFFASLIVFGFVAVRQKWVPKKLVITLVSLVVVGVVAAFAMRGLADSTTTADARFVLMTLALRMFSTSPILGVGANNYILALEPFVTVEFANAWISTVHNKYLLVAAETGVVGLAAFLWLLAASVFRGLRVALVGDRVMSPIALGLACGLLANMVHMTVNIFHDRTHALMFWLILGFLAAIWNINGRIPSLRAAANPTKRHTV